MRRLAIQLRILEAFVPSETAERDRADRLHERRELLDIPSDGLWIKDAEACGELLAC